MHQKTIKNVPMVQHHDMLLTEVNPKKLKLSYNNTRIHSDEQIDLVCLSIKEHGFTNPITCDDKFNVLNGVGRLTSALKMDLKTVPVRILRGLTEIQKRSLIIRDNQLSQLGTWDHDVLREEFLFLEEAYNFEDFGFNTIQIDEIFNNIDYELEKSDIPNKFELQEQDVEKAKIVTMTGDLWLIGKHKILCGSCLDLDAVKSVLGNDRIQMVITDPPYNVKTSGHIRLDKSHKEFMMAAGEMTKEEFIYFLSQAFSNISTFCIDGALVFSFMDWRHMHEIMSACDPIFGPLKQLIIWVKNNGGMGTFYRSRHEMVFVYKFGDAPHINNFELGQHGRYRTNVWEYAGVNTFKQNREEELSMHPTVKPVQMIEDAILDCSNRKGMIFDAFLGSGTTMVAAQNQGRICYGIEIDPGYVDVAIERMQRIFDLPVIHAKTGKTYADIQKERLGNSNHG